MPSRLIPIEPPASTALLTGDPRRAFALAGDLMEQPRMSHQSRGLWGYTGTTPAGLDLTVQSTGSGGPGASAVLGDLAQLGVSRLIRIGSCLAGGDVRTGSSMVVEGVIGCDGTSTQLRDGTDLVLPDPDLTHLLIGIAPGAVISSHDLVARLDPNGPEPADGAVARDLQTAAVLSLAAKLGVEAAAVLVVADDGQDQHLNEADLTKLFVELGRYVTRRLEAPA